MLKHWQKILLFLVLFFFGTKNQRAAEATAEPSQEHTPSRYEEIAPDYLAMFTDTGSQSSQNDSTETTLTQKHLIGPYEVPQLSDEKLRQTVLHIFQKQHEEPSPKTTLMTPEVWSNLELFANDYHKPERTIVGAIKRTLTIPGEITLINMLTNPIDDATEIMERQNFVRLLVENDTLRTTIKRQLQKFKEHQSSLLSLQFPTDQLLQKQLKLIFNLQDTVDSFTTGTLIRKLSVDVSLFFGTAFYAAFTSYLLYVMLTKPSQDIRDYSPFDITKISPVFIKPILAAFTAQLGLLSFLSGKTINTRMNTIAYMRHRMQSLRVLFTLQKKTSRWVQHSAFAPIKKALKVKHLTTFKPLWKLLKTKTFKSNSYFFSHGGRIISALPLIQNHVESIFNGLQVIGLLDAYLSIAELIREHKNAPAKFCFVNLAKSNTPIIEAEDFWHPTIPADKVVTNSIALGTPGQPRNIVLTGPNAGGKSTILKALILCILLGQTFGVAPASQFTFTPFARINTYLNITDDISGKRSLFQAELYRAKTLLDEIKALPRGKFSFTILDEILTGTEPVEGEAAAYGIGKHLATFPQSIALVATHFQGLTSLEKDTNRIFKNVNVRVNKEQNNTLTYPFKLFNGISNQQIALQILQAEGFNPKIVELAMHVLQNPHPYMPTEDDK